jgi:diguanylate cyclase (GGDEF)-like protein/PAS domain S-box-containing protein
VKTPLKVLIVEDVEDDAKLALRALRGGGFDPTHRRVQTAADLKTALAQEHWDAVISDFQMPGFTGMDALRIFRSTGLDIPFILVSGTIGEEIAVDAMKSGASDYLMKASLVRLAPALERELKETQMRAAHRRTQETLADSEERFRQMAENIRDMFFLRDVDSGRLLYVSPAYEEIWGRSRESLYAQSKPQIEAIHQDDRESTEEKLNQGVASGKYEFEYRIVRPDGSIRWIETRGFPVRNAAGRAIRIAGVSKDITERKDDEDALQRFAGAMDTIADGIFLIDRSSMRIVHVNEAACRFQNQTREELLALEPWAFFSTSRAELEHAYDTLIASGEDAKPLEMPMRRRDGTQVWIELRRHAQRSGDRWTIVSLVRDISERKRAEDALRESKNLLQLVVETAPARIFWKDRDLRLLGCNTLFAKDAGYSKPDELTGKTDFEMGWKDQAELYRGDDMAVLESGVPKLGIEEPQTTPDGNTIWLRTSKVPLRDNDNQIIGILGLYDDITVRKEAERELHESQRRFSDLLGNVELISVMRDREERITYCNEYLLRLTGWKYEEVIGRNWVERFVPPEIAEMKQKVFAALLLNKPEAWHHESEILTRSGERRLVHWNNSVLRSGAGDVIGTASIGEDITEQKLAEIRIKRMNRVFAVLSGINALIVRVRDRDELFNEACRIAVEVGAFKMAWIGVIDPQTLDGKVVAWYGGEEGYVDKIRLTARDGTPDSERPACRALRLLHPVVCNDFAADPSMAPLLDEMRRRGHKSVACFPLTVAGRPEAVIALFAGEADVFDKEEMKLLNELAGNIAFAIDHLDKQERLDYLAYYDALTGLANRSLFFERLAQHMRSAASGGHKLALFLIDLERFKNINDSLGRPAGDALLRQVAEWLTHKVGDPSVLARVGADQFAVVLPEVKQEGDVSRLLEKWIESFLDHPFRLNDAVFRIGAKVGIALFPDDGADADTLFRHAEAALKRAKASGDRYLFYAPKMTEAMAGKLTLENQLRQALDKEEFVLYYQPKVNLASGKMTSAEALIRWNDPRTGLVPPGRFIPILEETGLIYEVGRWALRQAIVDYLRWRAAGLLAVRIAVNVSPLQLRHRGFIAEIAQVVGIDANAAAGLELEITESLIMEDVKRNIASLQAIREMGVTIAIDDFGTGFSSLSYLAKLPVDTLKIDRSFVIEMTTAPEGLALVSTIISLAHSLNLKVVAEGVETEEQSRLLRLLACDEMQGFLFSKPVPAEIFETNFLAPLPVA